MIIINVINTNIIATIILIINFSRIVKWFERRKERGIDIEYRLV